MRRRGQRYDDLSTTCGAAAAAVSWIRTNGVSGPAPQWPSPDPLDVLLSNASDFQFYTLVKAIYDDVPARTAICATSDFGQQMVLATEAIRDSAFNIIAKPDDNSTFKLAYRSAFPGRNVDVFLSTVHLLTWMMGLKLMQM